MRPGTSAFVVLVALGACSRSSSVDAPSQPGPSSSASVASASVAPAPPSGPRAYVSNEASGDVTVIDLASNKPVANIPVGKRPRGVQRSPDGKRVYVALSGSVAQGPDA